MGSLVNNWRDDEGCVFSSSDNDIFLSVSVFAKVLLPFEGA